MRPMTDPKETLQSARTPRRRGLVKRILLVVLALIAAFAAYQYFFQFRLSTRNPGTVAKGAAPDFSLSDETGKATTLASLTAHGPAVLVFYRGYW
jgi:cytochrome oxidase Cu insertion factor (SCO1/SenC/PrrC family)